MELPFTVVFEPPSREELQAALRLRRVWVAGSMLLLAIGATLSVTAFARADPAAETRTVPLTITSEPAGASVLLDQHAQGAAPLQLTVPQGRHVLMLSAPDAVDARYEVDVGPDGTALEAHLWRRQPRLMRLRPTLPGATLSDAHVLADGSVWLTIALRSGVLEAWRLDPASGALEPLLSTVAATRVAVSRDSSHVAYVGGDVGPPAPTDAPDARLGRIAWFSPAATQAPEAAWPAPAGDDVLDLSWSPRANQLLVVTGRSARTTTDVPRNRLWLLDPATGVARPLVDLPSVVVPGSETWSPDGERLALLAHAGSLNALCELEISDGRLRYLADLEPASGAPLAYPPLAWSADGQTFVFIAPRQPPTGVAWGWLQSQPRRAIYVGHPTDAAPTEVASTELDVPAWREDGRILGLGRGADDGLLSVRGLTPAGTDERLLNLPLRPASGYAAAWDADDARLLIADPSESGGIDYWLALLGLESGA